MRQRLLYIIAFASFWTGVDAVFYWLNRKAKRIVTFHNVLPDEMFVSNLANGVSDSASSFRKKVHEIGKRFGFSVDLLDPTTVTITFDDGFQNQYAIAGEILRNMGNVPAIIFVVGDVLDNVDPASAIIVDQLLHWVTFAPNGKYDGFELTTENRIRTWIDCVWPAFVHDVSHRGRDVLAKLDAQYPMSKVFDSLSGEYKRLRLTGISCSDAERLRKRGWLVGWHTKSHFPLSSMTVEEQRSEIKPACGFEDKVFSYPYGEEASVSAESVAIAESCGYPCAVSNITQGAMTGLYFLPRMSLSANRYLLHFRLSGAENFLRRRTLLTIIRER